MCILYAHNNYVCKKKVMMITLNSQNDMPNIVSNSFNVESESECILHASAFHNMLQYVPLAIYCY